MSDASMPAGIRANPPVDLAVAAWLGTPAATIDRGLREGWIRRPQPMRREQPSTFDAMPPPQASERSLAPEPPPDTVDQARVFALVRRLDAEATTELLQAAWDEAGADDAARIGALSLFLAGALNVPADDVQPVDSFAAIEAAASTASATARFVRLAGRTGDDLESLAAEDGGMRRALADHASWALTDDLELTRRADPQRRYDRYDSDTGEALLSDAWLGDRARQAAWRQAAATGLALETSGEGWRFIDRAALGSAPVEIAGSDPAVTHQVIFARDDGDRVSGGTTTDRIHGGNGDDILRGRGGADLIEGGAGDDFLQGGSGHDDLAGQGGNDEIEGGSGDDRLDGGSGNDEITGGRGDDLLRGGSGIDIYRFEAGDGTDTIDDDGGQLYFNDELLAGPLRLDGDGWISNDSRYRFTLDGDAATGGTMAIQASGSAAADANVVRVVGWKPGRFGISLAGDDALAAEASLDAVAAGGDELADDETASDDFASDEAASDEAANDQTLADATWVYDPAGEPSGSLADIASGSPQADDIGTAPPTIETATPDLPTLTWPEGTALPDLASVIAPWNETACVDLVAVAAAVDRWAIPAPPDVTAPPMPEVSLPTPADVADAVATDSGSDADDAATSLQAFAPRWYALHRLATEGSILPMPPEATLRPSAF